MDSRSSASRPPLNYRKPRPLEYAVLDDEGDAMTHNDGCTCRTCRRWDAQPPTAAYRRRWWHRFQWCRCESPEGYRCIYRRGHDGLHVPHMGSGYAWGDPHV